MRIATRICLLGVACLSGLLTETAAWAEPIKVPLPAGITASGKPPLQGIYAEFSFGDFAAFDLAELKAACAAAGKTLAIVGGELQSQGVERVYRTENQVAIYRDVSDLQSDPVACTATFALSHRVSILSGPNAHIESGQWAEKLPECPRFRRCTDTQIAGTKAICIDHGDGLVGYGECYSLEDGLARFMILGTFSYSDDSSGPNVGWNYGKVILNAAIDPAVFAGR